MIGHDAYGAVHVREADHDITRPMLLDFEEIPIVDDPVNHVLDVVGQIRFLREQRVERRILPVHGIRCADARHIVPVVLRKVTE